MHGNRMRCFLDGRDSIENIFPINIKSDDVEYRGEVFVFKKDVNTKEFIRDMAITFSVNGQVQHSLDNRFISQRLRKAYLKGYLLVNIDCSKMPRHLHEDIFMSSRAQMRDRAEYRNLIENIIKELRDNDYLTRLDEERRKEQIFQNPKDEKFLRKIVGRLLRDDKEIERLLGLNTGVIGKELEKIKKQVETKRGPFQGKRYPSYFRFKNLKPGNIKMLPQNGECKINIETDVENEYLIRPHDKGELKVKVRRPRIGGGPGPVGPGPDSDEVLDVNVVGPNEGDIRLRVKTKNELPIGTEVPIDIELSSPEGTYQLSAEIIIDEPHEKTKEYEQDKRKEYSLPQLIEVFRDAESKTIDNSSKCWDDFEWNELDICSIQESSREGSIVDAIAINMDSKELHNFIRGRKVTGKNIEMVQRIYKTSVYLISLVLFFEFNQRLIAEQDSKNNSEVQVNYEPDDMVSFSMKGLAKILLHVMTNENLLKEVENAEG